MIRWLWRKVEHDPAVDAAEEALARSAREGEIVAGRWPMINDLALTLSAMRSDNNFAGRIRAAYAERR